MNRRAGMKWCPRQESNPGPSVYKTAALPAELQGQVKYFIASFWAVYLMRFKAGRPPPEPLGGVSVDGSVETGATPRVAP
jgi:hypothetical protein